MKIEIYSDKTVGKIKPMHAVCGGPRSGGAMLRNDATEIFKEIGIPSSRLHDIEYPYGSEQFVDVHCIFPCFDADENDENNYNFAATDKYILAIKDAGCDVFYRLGESIDHFEKKLHIQPPKDYKKYARICEHIIRHYNEGWCSGYFLNIRHWEIWNEPESKGMWSGTEVEFYEFYTAIAKHLKECFPHLMIGGYSCVGFYSETRDRAENYNAPWFDTIVPFMKGFFEYIKGKDVPIDFFSWHAYTLSPEEVVNAGRYIRNFLDEQGYENTESYITEMNYFYSFDGKSLFQHTEFPADVLGAMIAAQNSPIDMIFYYDVMLSGYNAVFYKSPLDRKIIKAPAFNSFKFFGNLYRLENQIETVYDKNRGLYVLGASNDSKTGIAIASRDYEGNVDVYISRDKITLLSVGEDGLISREVMTLTDGYFTLNVNKRGIYYIEA